MGIAAIIGIVSSVIQAVRAFSPPEAPQQTQQPQQKADRLFEELDAMQQGFIQRSDLQTAFDRIATTTSSNADALFARLDADGDGAITRNEFSGSISRLADQLDSQYMRQRLHGGNAAPPPAAEAGFTREDLTGLVSNIASNFERADANGDGRVSIGEARAFERSNTLASATSAPSAGADGRSVEMMLQVVRLMQSYGIVGGSNAGADNDQARRISDKV